MDVPKFVFIFNVWVFGGFEPDLSYRFVDADSRNNIIGIYEKRDFKKFKFLLIKNKTDKSLKLFESFIKNNIPRCNKLSDTQYQFLFINSDSIRSSALIPIGLSENIGFLAISSLDEERFSPDMSMDYLLIIGKLISNAILRF